MDVRKALVALTGASLLLTGATLPPASQAKPAPSGQVVVDWNRIALRTVFTEARLPIPVGTMYLGFASLAVYDAVRDASKCGKHRHHGHGKHGPPGHGHHRDVSRPAAAAVAAHDVLVEYVPASASALAAELAEDLASLPDGRAKERGIALGAAAADDLIASRVGDGRFAALTYTQPPAIGIWRPTPPANAPMALPWLGFVTPLLLSSPTQIAVDGPDVLTSEGYEDDYDEVRDMGAATGSARSPAQTETARFWNANAAQQLVAALVGHYDTHPGGIVPTARTFAMVNASMTDALIATWRLKFDVGYWRPITAIHEGDQDGNPGTTGDPSWLPYANLAEANPPGAPVGTPPYPEYPSGHASIVNAFTESLDRSMRHRDPHLSVFSPVTGTTRTYTGLDQISDEAFHARIWLGIHFRDAMEDARRIGERAARIADQRLH